MLCLFGSLFRNYLPLHPISQLKALIISVFITIQGFDKTYVPGRNQLLKDSPG